MHQPWTPQPGPLYAFPVRRPFALYQIIGWTEAGRPVTLRIGTHRGARTAPAIWAEPLDELCGALEYHPTVEAADAARSAHSQAMRAVVTRDSARMFAELDAILAGAA